MGMIGRKPRHAQPAPHPQVAAERAAGDLLVTLGSGERK
jgi:hypothetical protein